MVYLDNAATTRVCPEAAEAAVHMMTECFGNPSTTYKLGREAKAAVDKAQAALAAAIKAAADKNGSKTDNNNTGNGSATVSGAQTGQTGLKASETAAQAAAAKADKVMASTGANTNGMLLAAVALTGIGWTMLDMKRRRMDVTARHSTR